jgi:hypothetical protein
MTNETRRKTRIAAMTADERVYALKLMSGDIYVSYCAATQQARRLREGGQCGPEYMADGRLFVLAVLDTYRAVRGCLDLLTDAGQRQFLEEALARFDTAVPEIKHARDALQHSEEYLIGAGLKQRSGVTYTQFYARGGETLQVVIGPVTINVNVAEAEAVQLASDAIVGIELRSHAKSIRASIGASRFT